jgi:DNA polymerase elongation subunit (family B)
MQRRQHCQQQEKETMNAAERVIHAVRAKALKFIANSVFGNLWYEGNRFYSPALAQYITAFGRMILEETSMLFGSPMYMDYPLEVIGGDTDSVFVKAGPSLQTQLHQLLYPVRQEFNKKTSVMNEIALESRMNDPNVTQNQYDLFVMALKSACEKVNASIQGMSLGIDKVGLVMAIAHKRQYALMRLNKEISVQNCDWKGFTNNQMGIAQFVLNLRPEIMFDLMTLCHSHANLNAYIPSSNLSHESSSRAADVFKDRLCTRVRNVIYTAYNKQLSFADFKIVNHINRSLNLYKQDHMQPRIPVQVQLGNVSNKLWRDKNQSHLGDWITKGDCIEYVMCHDFTVPEACSPVLFHMVDSKLFFVHVEWYLSEHLAHALFNLLSPFNLISKEELSKFISKVMKEIANCQEKEVQ